MATAQSIITDAFRELNIIAVGGTPTDNQLTEGLERLNRFLTGLFGYLLGEQLTDWQVPSALRTADVAANFPQEPLPTGTDSFPLPLYTAVPSSVYKYPPANVRIIWGGTAAETVYFPEQPCDGARMGFHANGQATAQITLDGNGRTIETATTQVYTSPYSDKRWLYRADLGDWKAIADLALSDSHPLPDDMDDLLVTGTAIRLAPRFSKTVSPDTYRTNAYMTNVLKARYAQAAVTVYGGDNIPDARQSFPVSEWRG